MPDLSTTYLGLKLRSPLVPSASPLGVEIDNLVKMEDCGAGALVLPSLFEEQILAERDELEKTVEEHTDSWSEASTYFPNMKDLKYGPEQYLHHISKAKKAVKIPVIASLNGATMSGWMDYAKKIQDAGADALELNIYRVSADKSVSGAKVEKAACAIVAAVASTVTIPVAVKISPFYTSLPHFAKSLVKSGAKGLVMFNRFMQPDLDIEKLETKVEHILSTAEAQRLPLRWTAILSGRVKTSLAASGGISEAADAVKMIMAGADVAMMASCLLRHGVGHLKVVEAGLQEWMAAHKYRSLKSMKGSMSQKKVAEPGVFERAHYIKALSGYKA
jgi:dihydroorotate dehydrogenase (fumarate)